MSATKGLEGIVAAESKISSIIDDTLTYVGYGIDDLTNNATFEEVEHAAELARVKEFIGDLTDGYDTIVGERGVGLSGGQKQRIALARLLLANPKIMILDDTTSAVDIETEQKIRQSIKEQSQGHTTFIISHRISSFENCDLVLVIEDGQIAQMGSNEDLLKQAGYYRDVYQEQNYGKK